MSLFDLIVEQKIKQAIKNGDFDDLKWKGKKLDLNKYAGIPADKRMAYSVMMNNDIVPEEVDLMRSLSKLKEERAACETQKERDDIDRMITDKSLRLRILIDKAKTR